MPTKSYLCGMSLDKVPTVTDALEAIRALREELARVKDELVSCWVNFFDPDKMAEAFQLPENEEILTCLALGYPAEGAGPLANHNSRKPIEAIRQNAIQGT